MSEKKTYHPSAGRATVPVVSSMVVDLFSTSPLSFPLPRSLFSLSDFLPFAYRHSLRLDAMLQKEEFQLTLETIEPSIEALKGAIQGVCILYDKDFHSSSN